MMIYIDNNLNKVIQTRNATLVKVAIIETLLADLTLMEMKPR